MNEKNQKSNNTDFFNFVIQKMTPANVFFGGWVF